MKLSSKSQLRSAPCYRRLHGVIYPLQAVMWIVYAVILTADGVRHGWHVEAYLCVAALVACSVAFGAVTWARLTRHHAPWRAILIAGLMMMCAAISWAADGQLR